MYKLKTTSLLSKFYSWIWNTEITKFKTMCPYFWMYVLTILLLPLVLISKFLSYFIFRNKKINKSLDYVSNSKLGRSTNKIFKPSRFWDLTGKICKWTFFICVGSCVLFALYILLFSFYQNPFKGFAFIGFITVIILVIYTIGTLSQKYSLGSKILSPFKLFGNMIYSLYKNVCPLIIWEKVS